MQKIMQTLQGKASGKTVLLLFIVTMAVYALMLLVTIPKVESYAPNTALFDLSPSGYTYQHATTLLENLGDEGRQFYLTRQLPLDFIYPGLFAIAYSLLLVWLFAKSFQPEAKIFYLALIPALGGLFDYLENMGIILMLNTFPELSPELVSLSSTFTLLKSIFTSLFFILLFVGFIALGFSKRKLASQRS